MAGILFFNWYKVGAAFLLFCSVPGGNLIHDYGECEVAVGAFGGQWHQDSLDKPEILAKISWSLALLQEHTPRGLRGTLEVGILHDQGVCVQTAQLPLHPVQRIDTGNKLVFDHLNLLDGRGTMLWSYAMFLQCVSIWY